VQLANATRPPHGGGGGGSGRAMSARELSANVGLVMKLARLYITRRRSLVLQQSAMNVSIDSRSVICKTVFALALVLELSLMFQRAYLAYL